MVSSGFSHPKTAPDPVMSEQTQVPNSPCGEELRKQLGAQLLAAADDGSLEAMLRNKARKAL